MILPRIVKYFSSAVKRQNIVSFRLKYERFEIMVGKVVGRIFYLHLNRLISW